MKVGRRGKDLAVRIPAALVCEMGLSAGDTVDVVACDDGSIGLVKLTGVSTPVSPD